MLRAKELLVNQHQTMLAITQIAKRKLQTFMSDQQRRKSMFHHIFIFCFFFSLVDDEKVSSSVLDPIVRLDSPISALFFSYIAFAFSDLRVALAYVVLLNIFLRCFDLVLGSFCLASE